MKPAKQPASASPRIRWLLWCLAGIGLLSAYLYVFISFLSIRFGFSEDVAFLGVSAGELHDRPVLLTLGLFGVLCLCYLVALTVALQARQDRWLAALIFVIAVALRGTLLFSTPILEIDIYRYMWDGAVLSSGVNPYRYTPKQAAAFSSDMAKSYDVRTIANASENSPARKLILQRVHFPKVNSVYPPVSQLVFAASESIVPHDASVKYHVIVMKCFFVLFDLGTLLVLMALLKTVNVPVGWSLAYGWCPLVLKEFANSGHLDSLAIFLTTLACWILVRAFFCGAAAPPSNLKDNPNKQQPQNTINAILAGSAAAFFLALAVGSKIYPLILAPLFIAAYARRLAWFCIVPAMVFLIATCAVLYPMMPKTETQSNPTNSKVLGDQPQDPSLGLRTFLGRWEINDLLFLIVVENVNASETRYWYTVIPRRWQASIIAPMQQQFGLDLRTAGFICARIITTAIFAFLALWFLWSAYCSDSGAKWLECAFLTIAWFWLLSPTQNPWYWLWALPLIPFARSRAWLLVSCLVFVYYLRFWFHDHASEIPAILGMRGTQIFDHLVVWLEFGPWFVLLFVAALMREVKRRSSGQIAK